MESLAMGSDAAQYLIEERHRTCEKVKKSENGWLKNPYEILFYVDHKCSVYLSTKVNLCRKMFYQAVHKFQMEKGVNKKKNSVT